MFPNRDAWCCETTLFIKISSVSTDSYTVLSVFINIYEYDALPFRGATGFWTGSGKRIGVHLEEKNDKSNTFYAAFKA